MVSDATGRFSIETGNTSSDLPRVLRWTPAKAMGFAFLTAVRAASRSPADAPSTAELPSARQRQPSFECNSAPPPKLEFCSGGFTRASIFCGRRMLRIRNAQPARAVRIGKEADGTRDVPGSGVLTSRSPRRRTSRAARFSPPCVLFWISVGPTRSTRSRANYRASRGFRCCRRKWHGWRKVMPC